MLFAALTSLPYILVAAYYANEPLPCLTWIVGISIARIAIEPIRRNMLINKILLTLASRRFAVETYDPAKNSIAHR